jgi:predicted ATPase
MAFPNARLCELDDAGIHTAQYDELEVVQLWRRFLDHPDSVLRHLLAEE